MRITEVAPADEAKVVDIICTEIDKAADSITAEASWGRLTQFFYDELSYEFYEQRPNLLRSIDIVKWAKAGHPAAARALRCFARDIAERSRFDEMLLSVRHYFLETAEQPFIPFPRGRHVVHTLMRDCWLPAVVRRVAEGTGLPQTRGRSTTQPSAAYFVERAFKRRGIKLKEQQINRICLNFDKLAARLEASMPPLAPSAF